MNKNIERCFELGQKVSAAIADEFEELNDADEFAISDRNIDDEGNQYFRLECNRNGKTYEAAASLIESL